ncbi:MAG TPA: VWA domain-containing protein [Vicinamibacterales bacterium]|nr:VWA domain-containing protein [Vicinamibacterales bacterium]
MAAIVAQVLAAQQPTFRTSVDVVQVDVSALDKDRRPVRGLTQSDFTVLEDGKARPIVAFVPVELAEASQEQPSAAWVRDVAPDVTTNRAWPEGRLVVIMFDWSIRFEDQALAKRIASAAVDQLAPDDLAAVIFSSGFSKGGVPQNFTADRARLLAAINQPFAVAMHNPPKGSPFHDPRNSNEVMIDDPEGYEAGDCYCRLCVPEAIARVADAVRDVRGRRKTLLFIGTYVRVYESLQGPTTRQGPEFRPGLGGRPVVHPGVCSSYLQDARGKMERATSLANLTIHAIDPVGLETEWNSPMGGSIIGQMDRRDDLAALADMTGGRAVMNTNAPESLVPSVFAESQSYYLLAFSPADLNAKGKFHKIEVKVNRPGVSVRTRSGYYAGETRVAGNKPSVVTPETVSALEGVLPRNDVPLSVSAVPLAASGKNDATVAIAIGVRHAVGKDPTDNNAPVKVLAAAFDRNGRSVQSEQKTVGIALPSSASGDVSYEVLSRLPLKPGRYELRVALDAAAARSGSVYTYVDVPDFAEEPLSMSGVVLSVVPAWPTAPSQGFPDLLPIVPTTRRDFAPTDRVSAFVRVYQKANEPPQPASVKAQILDVNGRVVTSDAAALEPHQFARNHSADYRIRLPIDRLNPGEYLFNIEATRQQTTVPRSVRFRIANH